MEIGALDIRILDVIDVLVVAYLMYFVYRLVRGTMAFNIFIGVVLLYVGYLVVESLDMRLLSLLLGSVVAFGVIILIIIFQPEVREFLLVLGKNTLKGRLRFFDTLFGGEANTDDSEWEYVDEVVKATQSLSDSKTGALMVFSTDSISDLEATGTKVNSNITAELLENIFFKNAPLHDGAVIIKKNRISSASCILPVTKNRSLESDLGLRHRAGIGVTENFNALSLMVSEETGDVSIAINGVLERNLSMDQLSKKISNYLNQKS